ALDGKCDLFLDRFLEAERRRDREEMQLNRNTLAPYDVSGKYRAGLEAPGRLTIRASGYGCDCLAPVKAAGWRVEISGTPDIAWRDGGPLPGVPLTPRDRPVPAVRTFPESATWGHTLSCPRRELAGVEVWIAKYEERDKRLVLGPERRLGECPILSVELEQGSYRCALRPRDAALAGFFLPVMIERGSHWEQDVTLYRSDEIPAGFRLIAGGPFTFGGTWAGGAGEEQTLVTRDFFLSEFATTCGEYLEFLNALCDSGGLEEARRRQPREADKKWWIEETGRFRLPTPAESPKFPWNARWPVFAIDWFDAVAYAVWKSAMDGVPYRLMHEEEYEKAARGVDGRGYSFGNDYDSSYSHTSTSVEGGVTPLPVGSFPSDESPCGARDLSGGVTTWCWNAPNHPWREWRATRGGAWSTNPAGARAAFRRIEAPTHLAWFYGVRLVAPARRD
ncbi:MAG: formylglycine-generating enzyme family protein, partial [Planctomycetes bacterium]|nr:formylglycine-generating enzyme family protein [Planctomycetota bacterium]